MSENQTKEKSVWYLVWDFCSYTTAHGFARIPGSKTNIQRICWCLVMAGALTMFSVQVYDLFNTYMSRHVATRIKMQHETSISFPAVTLCNLNIVRKSKISAELQGSFENFFVHNDTSTNHYKKRRRRSEDAICFNYLYCNWKYSSLWANQSITTTSQTPTTSTTPATTPPPTTQPTTTVPPTTVSTSTIPPTTVPPTTVPPTTVPPTTVPPTTVPPTTVPPTTVPLTTVPPTTKASTTLNIPTTGTSRPTEKVLTKEEKEEAVFSGSLSQPDPSTLTKESRESEELSVNLASQPEDLMSESGHQFSDMVLSCTYRGISCTNYTEKIWSNFWHYKYGNCFVFNSGKDSSGNEKTILRSNKPGPTNGLILELNTEQQEYVGQLTQEAGIRILVSKQGEMPSPLEKGFSIAPGYSTSVGIRQVHIIREDPFKNKSCLNSRDIDRDNLYRIRYNVSYSSTVCKDSCLAYRQLEFCGCMEYRFPNKGQEVCDVLNVTVISCLNKVQLLYQENKLGCSKKCRPPCIENIFKLTISSSRWPSDNYQKRFLTKLQEERGVVLDPDDDPRAYFVKFQLFFEELNYEIIEEYLAYEVINFISDIGGQLGLWIGISCLTATEFLELILLMLAQISRKILNKMNIKGNPELPRSEHSQNKNEDMSDYRLRRNIYNSQFSASDVGSDSFHSITMQNYDSK